MINYNTFGFEVIIDPYIGSITDMMLVRVGKRLYHRMYEGNVAISKQMINNVRIDIVKSQIDTMKNRINKRFNRWERKALKAKQRY